MVKTHAKTPRIQSVFEKDKNGVYTKEALFYQDILQYRLKTGNKEFKLRQLGLWLLEKNKHSPDFYGRNNFVKHTPMANRFANTRDRIQANIQDLISLNLLTITRTKAEKVDIPVDLYRHSGDGYFIAWLLKRENPKGHKKANEILYDLIQSNLEKHDSRHIAFLSKEYEKFKEKGMLDMAFDLLEAIIQERNEITTVFEAIDAVPGAQTTDTSIHKKFHDATLETLNNLDDENRISQLFYIKSLLENRILKQYPPKDWEDLQRENLGYYLTTILYAKCHICGWGEAVGVDTSQFVNVHRKNFAHGNCPKCFSKEQLHVSTELPDRPIRIAI